MNALNPQSRTKLDAAATALFARLSASGFLTGKFEPEAFHRWKMHLKDRFESSGTTITALMERTLFGLALAHRPTTTVALGSYEGYALAWIAAACAVWPEARAIGIDLAPRSCELAARNFNAIGLQQQVQIRNGDAFDVEGTGGSKVDLLYIDVEAGGSKAAYAGLLERWYPRLSPGTLVLAHDICVEKFSADLHPYLALVRDKQRFRGTASLRIDFCGLEVTRV